MKTAFLSAALFSLFLSAQRAAAQFGNIVDRVNNAATNRANQKIDQGINKGLDKVEDGVRNGSKKPADTKTAPTTNPDDQPTQAQADGGSSGVAGPAKATPPSMRSYANYDFVPGNNIIFEDDFRTDQDGEFAEHWDLLGGQAVLNKFGDGLVMKITDGNYGKVTPLMKNKAYLPKEFTLEYDYYMTPGAYPLDFWFDDAEGTTVITCRANRDAASAVFQVNGESRDLSGMLPEELQFANFNDRWHHIAFIMKGRSIKMYIDQFRVLTVPNNTAVPARVVFGGIGAQADPLIFKNIRIAEGGGANMIGAKFTEGKYISHGIHFDVNKAIIKPESMGELTAIQTFLVENGGSRFEIGGHTDADGSDADNLVLSQKRADAVKAQLVSMGVEASRLTAKGYGKTKPVADNATFEGKAQNRRVEFVKL
ncbi:OmpA family protein [Fibrella sp. HMF5335]|uniref:OmpA family protein n=1 Tax=Fibrella rubiginis TaxID=2817060 RepID=A0A939GDM1_9BACT|nr:OmpA family protein [Fibrella rubiginis]MBO0935833.1 OmpA family protein [Fibrella rubiginis]